VRVRVRYPEDERRTLYELEHVRIHTPRGFEVPFLSVADIKLRQGYFSIVGSNGLRTIAVTASADTTRANPSEVVADLSKNYLDDLAARYGHIVWSVQGVEQNNQETLAGLKSGFIIAILGIFVIMAAIFRSYLQPFIILITIPFGIIGAVFGHLALGIPVTFLSLFGIVALSGVVVNDAIVLIECINNLLADGVSFSEAVCQGGVRRFRAIFLTSATTVGGLLPLILEQDLEAQIVIPMAIAIAAGVAFATLLTLFMIPALLGILNDARRVVFKAVNGRWPLPEEVEPGRKRSEIRQAQADVVGTQEKPAGAETA